MEFLEFLREKFLVFHFVFGLALIGLGFILFWLRNSKQSQFKFREADRAESDDTQDIPVLPQSEDPRHRSKKKAPLSLPGIRIDAPPHEILGVSPQATRSEINAAFKTKMQQYHPDRIARPGTSQWHDAQRIASAINEARAELLKKAK